MLIQNELIYSCRITAVTNKSKYKENQAYFGDRPGNPPLAISHFTLI